MGWTFSLKRHVRFVALLFVGVSILLSGCCRQFQKPWVPWEKCPQEVSFNFEQCPDREPCSDQEKCNLQKRLEAYDVKIIRVGEDMKIVLSSDRLFKPWSANFKFDYLCVLDHLATYLWCFRKIDVKVAGFTDCYKNEDFNTRLSTLQAERVAKFLWAHNIDARLVHTRGYGPRHPIANQGTYYQRSRNRRIEITFRDIPDTK